jgi:hypothetical protein
LTLDGRDADAFVVGAVVRAKAGDDVAGGVGDLDVEVAGVGQAGAAAGKRADLAEIDLEIEGAGCFGDDAVPVFVAGEAEDGVGARIDRGVDVEGAACAEEGGDRAGVVEFERVVLEDDDVAAGGCNGLGELDAGEVHFERFGVAGADEHLA